MQWISYPGAFQQGKFVSRIELVLAISILNCCCILVNMLGYISEQFQTMTCLDPIAVNTRG